MSETQMERLDTIARDCGTRGWDSYGADPVTGTAVDMVKHLLASMFVAPTVKGGIAISFANEGITFEVDASGMLDEVFAARSEVSHWYATCITTTDPAPGRGRDRTPPT